jgi:hypothetical protein
MLHLDEMQPSQDKNNKKTVINISLATTNHTIAHLRHLCVPLMIIDSNKDLEDALNCIVSMVKKLEVNSIFGLPLTLSGRCRVGRLRRRNK